MFAYSLTKQRWDLPYIHVGERDILKQIELSSLIPSIFDRRAIEIDITNSTDIEVGLA